MALLPPLAVLVGARRYPAPKGGNGATGASKGGRGRAAAGATYPAPD